MDDRPVFPARLLILCHGAEDAQIGDVFSDAVKSFGYVLRIGVRHRAVLVEEHNVRSVRMVQQVSEADILGFSDTGIPAKCYIAHFVQQGILESGYGRIVHNNAIVDA